MFRSSLDTLTESRLQITEFAYLNISGVMAICLTLVAVILVATKKIKILRTPVELRYSAFLAYLALGWFYSVDRLVTVQEWFRVCAPFALYLVVSRLIVSSGGSPTLRKVLVLSSLPPVIVGMYQFATGSGNLIATPHPVALALPDDALLFARVPGTFVLPMAFGLYLVALLPITFVELRHARERGTRILLATLITAMLIMLLATYTRGAWLGFIVSLTVFGALRLRRLLVFPASLAASLALWPTLLGPIYRRWTDIFDPRLYETSTVHTRLELWTTALTRLFPEHPVLGYGLGTFPQVYRGIRWVEAAHNDYLRVLIEGGVMGLALYLWLLWAVVALGWRKFRCAKDDQSKDLAAAFLSVICGYLVIQVSDNLFGMPVVQFYFWALVALMARSFVLENVEQPS